MSDFYSSLLKQRQAQPTMEDELVKQYNEQLQLRQASIADAKARLVDEEAQELTPLQKVNIAPILAATDAWFGGNMAKSYKGPELEDKKAFQLEKLKNQIGQQEAGLLDDRFNVTRMMMEERRAKDKGAYQEQRDILDDQLKMAMLKEKLAAQAEAAKNKKAGKEAKAAGELDQKILKTKESQKIQAQINLRTALRNYKKLVNEHGITLTGDAKDKLNSAYADLKIKYKEGANLGALTGPDVGIIVDAVAPSTGARGAARLAAHKLGFGGGTEGLIGGIDQIDNLLESDYKNTQSALESAFGSNSGVLTGYRNKFHGGAQEAPQGKTAKVKDPATGEVLEIEAGDLESALKDGMELVP